MNLFIIGAGASRGTFQKPDHEVPTAAGFGKVLARVRPDWVSVYPNLAKVVKRLRMPTDDWSLVDVWTWIDYQSKLKSLMQPLPRGWRGADTSRELRSALLDVYGRRCDKLAPGRGSTLVQTLNANLSKGDVVVSFNYDTIAERVVRRIARKRSWQFVGPVGSRAGVTLAKPHGSTSWTVQVGDKPAVEWPGDGTIEFDSIEMALGDDTPEPLVVGAVPIKSELVSEVQRAYRVPDVFKCIQAQWKALVEALAKADDVIVMGYSFPAEDQYGRFLFREALRSRSGSRALRLHLFELDEHAARRSHDIREVFGAALGELHYCGPIRPKALAS